MRRTGESKKRVSRRKSLRRWRPSKRSWRRTWTSGSKWQRTLIKNSPRSWSSNRNTKSFLIFTQKKNRSTSSSRMSWICSWEIAIRNSWRWMICGRITRGWRKDWWSLRSSLRAWREFWIITWASRILSRVLKIPGAEWVSSGRLSEGQVCLRLISRLQRRKTWLLL